MQIMMRDFDGQPAGTEQADLIALGGDRFLFPQKEGSYESVSFFGAAKQGLADNLIAPYFAARRVF